MSESPKGHSWWKRYAVGGALLAAGVAGGSALGNTMVANADPVTGTASTVAGATTSTTADTTTADSTSTAGTSTADATTVDESRSQRSDEVLLTGSDADKVTAAALAAYPGATIQRVETDSAGVFEAHLTTTDGQELTVQIGADFTVTGTETHSRGGHGDHGGSGEVLLTGSDADKVTAAALAAYPGATIQRVETDSAGVFEAHLTTTDGQELTVQIGTDFTVTGTETHGDR